MRLVAGAFATLVLAGASPAATPIPVRMLSQKAIAMPHGVLWLGPSFNGLPARAVRVRFNLGTAVRIDYQLLAIWNYDTFVPPQVRASQTTAVQTFPLDSGGTGRFFLGVGGTAVVEVEKQGRTAALVSRYSGKVDLVKAAQQVTTRR